MSAKDLPSWDLCVEHVQEETASALERFIYDQEPTDDQGADIFRAMLADVLREVRADVESGPCSHSLLLNVLYAARHIHDLWSEFGLDQICMNEAMARIEKALEAYDDSHSPIKRQESAP